MSRELELNLVAKLKEDIYQLFMFNIETIIVNIEDKYSIKIDRSEVVPSELLPSTTCTSLSESDPTINSTTIITAKQININILNCRAKTLSGEQCSRKIKNSTLYCGSHINKRPHGSFI